MARPEKIRGIHRVKKRLASGVMQIYYFDRYTGKRLHGDYGSQEFLESLTISRASMAEREKGMLREIIRLYQSSKEFFRTAKSTQQAYKYLLKQVDGLWGDMPIKGLSDQRFRALVLAWAEKEAETQPKRADNIILALKLLAKFALHTGRIEKSAIIGMGKFYKSNRADKIWGQDTIKRFRAAASPDMLHAITLALYTGQRRGDLLALRWGQYDGEAISLTQQKTGAQVYIPCVKPLKAMLDSMPRRSEYVLTQQGGKPWPGTTFNKHWLGTCRAAGIEGLHFHDLRGTAVTMLAEAGCEIPEIAAITGHSVASCHKILAVYMSKTRKMARNAMDKLERTL